MPFPSRGPKGGVSEIGRRTNAAYVLAGSVRKAGERVRITARCVNAQNDAQVWGERYDRNLNDIFALQDEISKAIVAALSSLCCRRKNARSNSGPRPTVKAYKFI